MTAPQITSNKTQVNTEEKRLKLTITNTAVNNNNAIFSEGLFVPLLLDFRFSRIDMFTGVLQGNRLVHVNKRVGEQNRY